MAGYYEDAEKYHISSWVLGCFESEIDNHVQAERKRIVNLLEGLAYIDEAGQEIIVEFKSDLIALIKGEQK